MTIIRQGSLFDLQELYDLEPTQRFFSTIDIDPIFAVVTKKSRFGRPVELNYAAILYSLVARITERIPFIKDLVKRLRNDMIFRLDCGFLVSDSVPSEAAYSRIITIISESKVLEGAHETLLLQDITEGFIMDDTASIDATHFEAKDQAPPKEEKPKTEPKKRGRKSKEEREQWLIEKAELEASLPLFEKKIEEQLDAPLDKLRAEITQNPQWGVKKNSEGKNVFWNGYKAHLAVGAKSQYILQSLFSSGNLNDSKAAIPLLKGIHERLPLSSLRYETMDAGYDYEPIYTQIHRMGHQAVIAYNKRNEPEQQLALINILHLLVSENIHIATIVMTRNMKH